jgi:katanin p60 ATPase-containing subunit A1
MKTELLIQMDGLSGDSSDQVFVLAASNLPWDLDGAMLRRLEKRILVTLPTAEAREAMLRLHLPEGAVEEINYSRLASMTEEWSGSDIRLLCKEAAMHPLRRLMADIERAEIEAEDKAQNRPHRRSAAERAAQKASEKGEPAPICELKVGLVTEADVTRALETVHRAPGAHLDRYQEWQDQFGAA